MEHNSIEGNGNVHQGNKSIRYIRQDFQIFQYSLRAIQ